MRIASAATLGVSLLALLAAPAGAGSSTGSAARFNEKAHERFVTLLISGTGTHDFLRVSLDRATNDVLVYSDKTFPPDGSDICDTDDPPEEIHTLRCSKAGFRVLRLATFSGPDTIEVSGEIDFQVRVLSGPGGDDVFTGSGDDFVIGDRGNDLISTGRGRDVIKGGPGKDEILDGPGEDRVVP